MGEPYLCDVLNLDVLPGTGRRASKDKEQTQRQIAGDLLKRAFGGSARSLVMGALAAQPASREELDEIRGMLDAFAKERGRS